MKPNVIRPTYNEANLLDRIDVWQQQPMAPAGLLDPATATLHAVTGIEYDAHGKRTAITSGNATVTTYAYDPLTFRLTRLVTTRPSSFPANARTVQDLTYTYDPAGNITHIQDDADIQNVVYFRNQRVEPSSDYGYDAIYRLATATGREHLGQTNAQLNPPQQVTDDDGFRTGQLQPGDGNAMGTYTEKYQYDPVGNLLALTHAVSSGSWTRRYAYREPSQITAAETNNRLTSTSLPGDLAAGPYSATYAHDAHGNMTRMPHLPVMAWDELDHLRSTTRQVVTDATPETFYNYDSGGERERKVTDRQAPAGQTGTRAKERIYLGGLELYREYQADGVTVKLTRETLHLSDGPNRVALVETRTQGTDKGVPVVVRYQHGNHLGSATLELDDAANVITYEEYFPYGSPSYQSVRSQTETPKRYRYTGKERDEESGLYCHGARYYAGWLGTWTSTDPAGAADGPNLYSYVGRNPIRLIDPGGRQGVPSRQEPTEEAENFGIKIRFDETTGKVYKPSLVLNPLSTAPAPAPDPAGEWLPLGQTGRTYRKSLDVDIPPPKARERTVWNRGGRTVAMGGLGIGVAALILTSGPVGWVAGLAAAFALSGGVAGVGIGASQLTASYSGQTTAAQDEEINRAAGTVLSVASSPTALVAGTATLVATGTEEGLRKGAFYGGLAEAGGGLLYGGARFLYSPASLAEEGLQLGRGSVLESVQNPRATVLARPEFLEAVERGGPGNTNWTAYSLGNVERATTITSHLEGVFAGSGTLRVSPFGIEGLGYISREEVRLILQEPALLEKTIFRYKGLRVPSLVPRALDWWFGKMHGPYQ